MTTLAEVKTATKAAAKPTRKRAAVKPTKTAELIHIAAPNMVTVEIPIVGDSSLVCHAWDHKVVEMMLNKQMKGASGAKVAKDPHKDYLASLYEHPDGGYGFPMVAFKSAAVDACSYVHGLTKVAARGAFHLQGEFARIEGEPRMRQDMVRVGMGTADIRFRGEFPEWKTTLNVRMNVDVLSVEQLVNLLNIAGFSIGVGEYRPQKNGSWGMFHVDLESN